jgi:hypothetical protein
MIAQRLSWARLLLLSFLVVTLPACANLRAVAPDQPVERVNYQQQSATLASAFGCDYKTTYKKPGDAQVPFTVVLGHGFLRSQRNFRNLSVAIANAGIPVITLEFCAMRPWNGNHQFNAADMRAVANHYNAQPVIFAGHSAGAFAAVLAADRYSHTVGLLLLDYVNPSPRGTDALKNTSIPVVALFGGPSACNANARAMHVLRQRNNTVVEQFHRASHCAFESPTSRLCQLLCANGKADESQQQRQIIERTVKALINFQVQPT